MVDFLHNKDDQIMRYLDGELEGDELQSFRDRLANDPQLAAEVDGLRVAIESVKQFGLHQRVQSVRSEMKQEIKGQQNAGKIVSFRKMVRYGLSLAASVFFIFLVIEGYKFYKLNPKTVYDDAYISYTIGPTRGDNIASPIEQQFSNKQYEQVIAQAALKQNFSDKERFLVALSYLETGSYTKSIQWLKPLHANSNPYKQDAEFYLSMAYLLNEDYDHSLSLLKTINNNSKHLYNERVSTGMIRKIKMLKWR